MKNAQLLIDHKFSNDLIWIRHSGINEKESIKDLSEFDNIQDEEGVIKFISSCRIVTVYF
jgi:hypothetical protein